MRFRWLIPVIVLSFVCAISGCQKTPETAAVTSKNNGVFDNVIASDRDYSSQENTVGSGTDYYEEFLNAGGTIRFTMNLEDVEPLKEELPVIRVSPHSITTEEAKHVADVLFGETDVYEYSEEKSKGEIESLILSLKQKVNDQTALEAAFGADQELIDALVNSYERMISNYEMQYSNARETVEERLCGWEFYPLSYYIDQAGVDTGTDEYANYNKTVYIRALSQIDDIPYQYWVCNRDEADYEVHYYSAYIDYSGAEIDLYGTVPPTEEEVANARAEAERVLAELNMGEWAIESCEAEMVMKNDGSKAYFIDVIAVPVYEGIKVIYQDMPINFTAADNYAANYNYESAEFKFSQGNMVLFYYEGMLDVVSVVNEDVAVLSFEEAVEAFKTYSKLTEIEDQGLNVSDMEVVVDNVELGLLRVRIQNEADDYYLVPTYTFYGEETLYDDAGDILMNTADQRLITINAVDGSIINTQLGY